MVPAETDDSRPEEPAPPAGGKILPFTRARPDWLTRPGEDPLDAAAGGGEPAGRNPGPPRPRPILVHPATAARCAGPTPDPAPGGPDAAAPPPEANPRGVADPAKAPIADLVVGFSAEFEAASAAPPAAPSAAPPARPAAGPAAGGAASAGGSWAPAASSVPILKLDLPVDPVAPDETPAARRPERAAGLPGADEDRVHPVAPVVPLQTLHEPWWQVGLDALRTNRWAQLTALGAVAAVAALSLWMGSHGVATTPLSEVRRHPGRFDGRVVTVRGRVGDDVFAVGGGWAFFIRQGRDTIVAFSRTRNPEPRKVITVKGQVSTGFLDGSPRQALFEDPSSVQ